MAAVEHPSFVDWGLTSNTDVLFHDQSLAMDGDFAKTLSGYFNVPDTAEAEIFNHLELPAVAPRFPLSPASSTTHEGLSDSDDSSLNSSPYRSDHVVSPYRSDYTTASSPPQSSDSEASPFGALDHPFAIDVVSVELGDASPPESHPFGIDTQLSMFQQSFDPLRLKTEEQHVFMLSSDMPSPPPPAVGSPPAPIAPPAQKNVKKRRQNTNASSKSNPLFPLLGMTEEQMVEYSSEEFENVIKNLHTEHCLSAAQEKELKRIRRLIKNREYAQSSRDKKKAQMEEIDARFGAKCNEVARLQQQVTALQAENVRLQSEVQTLQYQLSKVEAAAAEDPSIRDKIERANPIAEVPAPASAGTKRRNDGTAKASNLRWGLPARGAGATVLMLGLVFAVSTMMPASGPAPQSYSPSGRGRVWLQADPGHVDVDYASSTTAFDIFVGFASGMVGSGYAAIRNGFYAVHDEQHADIPATLGGGSGFLAADRVEYAADDDEHSVGDGVSATSATASSASGLVAPASAGEEQAEPAGVDSAGPALESAAAGSSALETAAAAAADSDVPRRPRSSPDSAGASLSAVRGAAPDRAELRSRWRPGSCANNTTIHAFAFVDVCASAA